MIRQHNRIAETRIAATKLLQVWESLASLLNEAIDVGDIKLTEQGANSLITDELLASDNGSISAEDYNNAVLALLSLNTVDPNVRKAIQKVRV